VGVTGPVTNLGTLPYPAPNLGNDLVLLRRWDRRDIDCVRLAATDIRIPWGTSVPAQYTEAAAISFVERQHGRQTDGEGLSLAVQARSAPDAVGLICALFRAQPGVIGLRYWVVPSKRSHGYAKGAIALLSRWLLAETPTTRVEAFVEPGNLPSRRALEGCGFQEEGCLRSYIDGKLDAIVYSLVRLDLRAGMQSQK